MVTAGGAVVVVVTTVVVVVPVAVDDAVAGGRIDPVVVVLLFFVVPVDAVGVVVLVVTVFVDDVVTDGPCELLVLQRGQARETNWVALAPSSGGADAVPLDEQLTDQPVQLYCNCSAQASQGLVSTAVVQSLAIKTGTSLDPAKKNVPAAMDTKTTHNRPDDTPWQIIAVGCRLAAVTRPTAATMQTIAATTMPSRVYRRQGLQTRS